MDALTLSVCYNVTGPLRWRQEGGIERRVFLNSSDDGLAERSLNRTLSISSQGCPDSSKYNTSSSLQPSKEPLASFPLHLMQENTVCTDCYLGVRDSCLEVGAPLCWEEHGHLPGELKKTPNPDGQQCRKRGTIPTLQKGD